jgi:hypothetical protein
MRSHGKKEERDFDLARLRLVERVYLPRYRCYFESPEVEATETLERVVGPDPIRWTA